VPSSDKKSIIAGTCFLKHLKPDYSNPLINANVIKNEGNEQSEQAEVVCVNWDVSIPSPFLLFFAKNSLSIIHVENTLTLALHHSRLTSSSFAY
jgi:hypothetical protein